MKTFKNSPVNYIANLHILCNRVSLCNWQAFLFMTELNCKTCGSKFIVDNNRANTAKYCSKKCVDYSDRKPNSGSFKKGQLYGVQFKKGHIPWSQGKYWATSELLKTDMLAYKAMHKRINRRFEKTGKCVNCNIEKRTVWASIDHKYIEHDRSNWLELCPKCHSAMDRKAHKEMNKL